MLTYKLYFIIILLFVFSFIRSDLSGTDFSGIDYNGADLSGTDFSGDNLSRADLSEVDLSGADLSEADLSGADLSLADLETAYLSGAKLSGADLSFANLRGAQLINADLSETDLMGVKIEEANFKNVKSLPGWIVKGLDKNGEYTQKRLVEAIKNGFLKLSGAYLVRVDLSETDLNKADLSRAYLRGADLSRANLSGADLSKANLSKTNLDRANLDRADLSGADLSEAYLIGTNLNNTKLIGANFNFACYRNFSFIINNNCRNFGKGTSLSNNHNHFHDWIGKGLDEYGYYTQKRLVEAIKNGFKNLNRANLSEADLSGVNLSGANLSGADLSGVNLSGADLSGADLSGAKLSGADLSGVDFSGADLSGADLSRANFSGADIEATNFSNIEKIPEWIGKGLNQYGIYTQKRLVVAIKNGFKNLNIANLSGADLSGIDFSGANLSGANLSNANLENATLLNTNIKEVNFFGANLSGVKFEKSYSKTTLITQKIETMKDAVTAYSVPKSMILKETALINLIIDFKKSEEKLVNMLIEEKKKKGLNIFDFQFESDELKASGKMKATLKGSNFDIAEISEPIQVLTLNDISEWKWQIKALKEGRQSLHLSITAIFEINGKEEKKTFRTYDRIIEVIVKNRIKFFFSSNWSWIALVITTITAIFTAWLTVFLTNKKTHKQKKKKSKEEESKLIIISQ